MALAPKSVDAVILAGGINTIPLYEGYQPGYKALIQVGDQPSIRYVLGALKASRYIGRIGVVGSEADLRPIVGDDVSVFAAPGDTIMESLAHAWSLFHEAPMVLTVVADLPLLKGNMVDGFLEACERASTTYPENAFLSLVPKESFSGAFAKAYKDMSAFRDVTVCHGNLLLANPRLLDNKAVMSRINAVYAARKSPVKSALAVGLNLGLTYVLGVLLFHIVTLESMVNRASRRFGFGIIPVQIPYPEVAVDVDEAADYELVQECLAASS